MTVNIDVNIPKSGVKASSVDESNNKQIDSSTSCFVYLMIVVAVQSMQCQDSLTDAIYAKSENLQTTQKGQTDQLDEFNKQIEDMVHDKSVSQSDIDYINAQMNMLNTQISSTQQDMNTDLQTNLVTLKQQIATSQDLGTKFINFQALQERAITKKA